MNLNILIFIKRFIIVLTIVSFIGLIALIVVVVKYSTPVVASQKALFVRDDSIGGGPGGPDPEIFLFDLNSKQYSKFTDGSDPTFSPDGKYIAFTRSGPIEVQGNPDIWIIGADGKGERNITKSDLYAELKPKWSPNGQIIAYRKGGFGYISIGALDTCFIKPDGTNNWCLKQVDWIFTANCASYGENNVPSCAGPEWVLSLHGFEWVPTKDSNIQTLLLESNEGGGTLKIYTITLREGRLEKVSFLVDGEVSSPSPNGDSVLFFSYQDRHVYRINIDGSNLVKIINVPDGCFVVNTLWSKDAGKILFDQYCGDPVITVSMIKIMNADGSGLTTLLEETSSERILSYSSWTPDEKNIVYGVWDYLHLNETYFELNLADGAITQLTVPKDNVHDENLTFFP